MVFIDLSPPDLGAKEVVGIKRQSTCTCEREGGGFLGDCFILYIIYDAFYIKLWHGCWWGSIHTLLPGAPHDAMHTWCWHHCWEPHSLPLVGAVVVLCFSGRIIKFWICGGKGKDRKKEGTKSTMWAATINPTLEGDTERVKTTLKGLVNLQQFRVCRIDFGSLYRLYHGMICRVMGRRFIDFGSFDYHDAWG